MRLTSAALGWTIDWSIEPTATEAADDGDSSLNGGTTAAYPVEFTATFDLPEEVAVPMRCNGWPDEDRG